MPKNIKNLSSKFLLTVFLPSIFIIIFLVAAWVVPTARAQSVSAVPASSATDQTAATSTDDGLQQQIDARNKDITELNAEIAQYTDLVDKTGLVAKTLQAKIGQLQANEKAIDLDIQNTKDKIDLAGLTIQKLGVDMQQSETKSAVLQAAIGQSMRDIQQSEGSNLIENFLISIAPTSADSSAANTANAANATNAANGGLTKFLSNIDAQLNFNDNLQRTIADLNTEKQSIQTDQNATENQKAELTALQSQLSGKKQAVEYTKTLQSQVLAETKDQESNYQKTLTDKQTLVASFEQEVFDYEAKLRYNGNPGSLPPPGSAPFAWPVDNVTITQLFGKTVGAEKLYVSGSHNGVDFRAAIGTPIKAVRDGLVVGTGDTDLTCKGASFGRWVFIKHDDGLSTISAHMSVIVAKAGQQVKTGDIIGYSGATGYVTGPHLHISVYASDSVSIQDRPSAVCSGKTYTMPIAPVQAYLDPMLYFPAYNK